MQLVVHGSDELIQRQGENYPYYFKTKNATRCSYMYRDSRSAKSRKQSSDDSIKQFSTQLYPKCWQSMS